MQPNLAKYALSFLLALTTILSNAQEFDKQFLLTRISAKDSTFNAAIPTTFIANGLPYMHADSLALNAELKKLKHSRLLDWSVIKPGPDFPHMQEQSVILLFVFKQRAEVAADGLAFMKTRFVDDYSGSTHHILTTAKDPVLVIDGEQVHHADVKRRINALKAADIYYIDQTSDASWQWYGQNAKNGLVRVFTRDPGGE